MRQLLDYIEKIILSNDSLKKFHPLYDALDTFLYSKNTTTKHGPHIRDSIDLKRTMIMVVFALMPAFLFGIWNVGYQHYINTGSEIDVLNCFTYGLQIVLPMYIVVFTVGGICEALFSILRNHEINEGFLVTGFLIPLTMPPTVPLWMLAVATIFGVVIGKEIFGGTGYNIFNPALVTRAFLFFAYPTKMSGYMVWVSTPDAITKATPLLEKSNDSLESTFTLFDMFFGLIPGSIGETSTFCILLGALFLIMTGIGNWRIMLSCCLGAIATSLLLNFVGSETNSMFAVTPLEHLVMGGFAFGAVFMATDPVSASHTNIGRWIYGFLIGFMCILIRCINPAYPEGMMLAILFGNAFAALIDYYVIQKHIKKRESQYAK